MSEVAWTDARIRDEFPLDPSICYLNHAAVAPWPRRTQDAIRRFADENLRWGARHYPRWLAVEERLRERLRRLVHAASTDEIALVANTSTALSIVAHGLDWRSGDNVVVTDQEFPSNRIVWEALRDRFGIEVREAPLSLPDRTPEESILAAIDGATRLVSISAVQFGSGLRLDLARIGRHCRATGALFCVDAIQALGAIDIDVEAIAADFLMADGHKWMLGPEGLALFYCRRSRLATLRLHAHGWHMVAAPGDFDTRDWRIAETARRFEAGSPNMLGIHALDASVGLLLDLGLAEIERRVLARQRRLSRAIADDGRYRLLSASDRGHDSGIVTFTSGAPEDDDRLFDRLARAGVCGARRFGGIRLSPHFHTPTFQLDRVLELLGIPPPTTPD